MLNASFLKHAVLEAVTHDGTCYMTCIASRLGLSKATIADNFIRLKDAKYVTDGVRRWAQDLHDEWTAKTKKSKEWKGYLPDKCYVQTPVLLAYASEYSVIFIMVTNIHEKRSGVNVIDVITPPEYNDSTVAIVLRVEGEKFDLYKPKKGCETDFNAFVNEVLKVI